MTANFTFLELAREALKLAPTPMSSIELWAFASGTVMDLPGCRA